MAKRNVNRAPAKTLSQSECPQALDKAAIVNPTGLLCNQWLAFEDQAALVVNPAASTGARLAWCWAEVEAMQRTALTIAKALHHAPDAVSSEAFEAMFVHRLQPLERVLATVVDQLAQEDEAKRT